MSAIDTTEQVLVVALENHRREVAREVKDLREERDYALAELERAQPACKHCGEDLPSRQSVAALCRIMSLELGAKVVALGPHSKWWDQRYCNAECASESSKVLPFVRQTEAP